MKKAIYWLFFFTIIHSTHCLNILSQDDKVTLRTFIAEKNICSPPVIDGHLSDSAWRTGTWKSGFLQQIPKEGKPPTMPTSVKILFDHNNLYVAIKCYDSLSLIKKRFSQRDQFSGDVVGIAFDSYNNDKTAYEFNVTSAGQKIDLMHMGDGSWDHSWNAVWNVKTSETDSGWVAEYQIPFNQLRYNNNESHEWGLHIWRWIDRKHEESQWQLIPINAPAGVHNFGNLIGISDIRSSRQAEFLPYTSLKYNYNGNNENPHINNGRIIANAGIDGKIGISSNFTLDATINPDFGQVEADPAELNLTAYETYFEEKRPFFLEGKEIFDFSVENNRLFYSRRIGASPQYNYDTGDDENYTQPQNTTILGSGKIAGRTSKGLSVGIMETVTSAEYGVLYTPKHSTSSSDTVDKRKILAEPLTNYFASRFKQEFNKGQTVVGGSINSVIRHLSTDEITDELVRSANTGGIDAIQYIKDKNYYVKANTIFSNLEGNKSAILKKQESHIHRFQRPDASHLELDSNKTTLTGSSAQLEIGKRGGKFRFGTNGSYFSPQLNINDIGFMPEADIIEQENWLSYKQNEAKKLLRSYSFNFFNSNRWTFGKERTRTILNVEFVAQFKSLWVLYIHSEISPGFYDTRTLRGGPSLFVIGYQGGGINLATNHSKRVSGNIEAVHFWNKNDSRYYYGGFSINANPVDRLNLKANIYYENEHFAYEYFEADFQEDLDNIYMIGFKEQHSVGMTFRAEYYVSPEISFQYYGNPLLSVVDYSDLTRVSNSSSKNVEDRFYKYKENEITYNEDDNLFIVNESNNLPYSFTNPDVSFGEFRSNFVFRYEYKLGSVFYLVWSHQQEKNDNINNPVMKHTMSELLHEPSNEVVMVKFSYWFNI